MNIRIATVQDYAQWLTLWEGYQTFYKTSLTEDVTQKTWARFLDPAEPMHCAVAEQDGVLIGIVHYIFHRSCWTAGDYVYLQDLFALPELRGKGVGRALIEHVYAAAIGWQPAKLMNLRRKPNDRGSGPGLKPSIDVAAASWTPRFRDRWLPRSINCKEEL